MYRTGCSKSSARHITPDKREAHRAAGFLAATKAHCKRGRNSDRVCAGQLSTYVTKYVTNDSSVVPHPPQTTDLIGRRGWTRTSDPLLRRQMLYPPELRARRFKINILTEACVIDHARMWGRSWATTRTANSVVADNLNIHKNGALRR